MSITPSPSPVYVPPVLLAVDGHAAHPHLRARAEHAYRDLAPVGHQDLLDGLDVGVGGGAGGEVGQGRGGARGQARPPSQPRQVCGDERDHGSQSGIIKISLKLISNYYYNSVLYIFDIYGYSEWVCLSRILDQNKWLNIPKKQTNFFQFLIQPNWQALQKCRYKFIFR